MHVPRSAGLVTAGCLLLAVLGAWPAGAASVALPDSAASGSLQLYAGTRPAVAPQGATSVKTVQTADGLLRSYRIFVPSGDVRAAPLVVALHGGLGSGVQFSRNSGLDGLATSNRFIVVYPEGVGRLPDDSGGAQTWNGGNCCGPAARQGIDDVGFVRRVVSDVAREYRIDRNRVYAVGHSNGGIMALRLACEASDVFAAVGVQSASLGMTRCAPAGPVAVIQIHGTADTNVPITGGIGTGISGVDFDPPRKAARAFAALDGCRARGRDDRRREFRSGASALDFLSAGFLGRVPHGSVGRSRVDGARGYFATRRGARGTAVHATGLHARPVVIPCRPSSSVTQFGVDAAAERVSLH